MWQHFKDFLAQPYSGDMDAWEWFLFLGLLLLFIGWWIIILKHIRGALE